jgi:hypothetical protein
MIERIRPYLGHIIAGVATGLQIVAIGIGVMAWQTRYAMGPDGFFHTTVWILGFFLAGVVLGAIAAYAWMNPMQRETHSMMRDGLRLPEATEILDWPGDTGACNSAEDGAHRAGEDR